MADFSSFLPREFLPSQFFRDFPKLIVAFILPTELNDKNTMDLDYKGEPVLTVGREVPFSNDDNDVVEVRELAKTNHQDCQESPAHRNPP